MFWRDSEVQRGACARVPCTRGNESSRKPRALSAGHVHPMSCARNQRANFDLRMLTHAPPSRFLLL